MFLQRAGWMSLGLCAAVWAGDGPLLPALPEAAATNAFVEYTHANFDLVMDRRLAITLFPKDAGARKGPPIHVSAPQFALYGARDQPDDPPVITAFTTVPAPKKQPDEISLAARLSNAALCGVKYKFRGASLQISGWVRNPPGVEQATPLQFEIDFAATHHFTPNIELADRQQQMAGWYVKTREKGGDDKSFKGYTYKYGDKVRFRKEAQFVENVGPWGARKVRLHSVDSGAGCLRADKRGSQPYPYTGFKCFLQVPTAPKKKTDSATLVITLE